MKNKLGMGIFFIFAGAFLALGPQMIFPVCPVGEKIMKCFWTAKAEIGIGTLIIFGGILLLTASSEELRKGVSLMIVGTGFIGILIPATLIGGCMNPEMRCNTSTIPAIYIIAGIIVLAALINAVYLNKAAKRG